MTTDHIYRLYHGGDSGREPLWACDCSPKTLFLTGEPRLSHPCPLATRPGPKPTTLRGRAAGAKELRAWVSADEYARWLAQASSLNLSLGDYLRSLTPPVTPQ